MSLPNIPPKLFTLSAVGLGYLLIDDLNSNEQNALGNWLMLTAQVLCTNAYYKQVQSDRMNQNISVDTLEKMINALKKEINELKK